MLTDNDLINYDCAVEVCVYVWKASINTQKDRVQRTFWLVSTQRFGEHDVPGEGKDAPHASCLPFSVDLSHLGVPALRACILAQSCPTLCDPLETVAHQAPLSMGFSRQEYYSGLPSPSPGDLNYSVSNTSLFKSHNSSICNLKNTMEQILRMG